MTTNTLAFIIFSIIICYYIIKDFIQTRIIVKQEFDIKSFKKQLESKDEYISKLHNSNNKTNNKNK